MSFHCLAHASFYRNVPVFYRFKDELHLSGIQVFLFRLLSTFPELDDFHIGCIVAVGVFYEAGRPAAGNVVEEQAGKVGRPFECLACPLVLKFIFAHEVSWAEIFRSAYTA